MFQKFTDRREAGRSLARKLASFAGRSDVIVLALPRGGVPVAFEVAKRLDLPLDVLVVRKLGAPGHEEFALGSIASGGTTYIDDASVSAFHVPERVLDEIIEREKIELERRERLYRGSRPPIDVRGKIAIIVDDGLATGSTMRAAIEAIRKLSPKEVIVAVPVCSPVTCNEIQNEADAWCVCVYALEPFFAVGLWYEDFQQTTDEEVERLLAIADAGGINARHAI